MPFNHEYILGMTFPPTSTAESTTFCALINGKWTGCADKMYKTYIERLFIAHEYIVMSRKKSVIHPAEKKYSPKKEIRKLRLKINTDKSTPNI